MTLTSTANLDGRARRHQRQPHVLGGDAQLAPAVEQLDGEAPGPGRHRHFDRKRWQ